MLPCAPELPSTNAFQPQLKDDHPSMTTILDRYYGIHEVDFSALSWRGSLGRKVDELFYRVDTLGQ